nr:hypothetical protein [Mycoplasmopsis bovis]
MLIVIIKNNALIKVYKGGVNMLKMVKILPSRIKWVFVIGSFLTLIYVLLNVMLPLLIKKYIDLILTEDRPSALPYGFFKWQNWFWLYNL